MSHLLPATPGVLAESAINAMWRFAATTFQRTMLASPSWFERRPG